MKKGKINFKISSILFLVIINAASPAVYSQIEDTGFDSCYFTKYDNKVYAYTHAKEFRYYSATGKLQRIERTHELNYKWVPDLRIIYSYNENQDISEVKTEYYIIEKSEWQLARKETWNYTGRLLLSKHIIQWLSKDYNYNYTYKSQWEFRTNFTYDGSNHLLSEIEEKKTGEYWLKMNAATYTYQDGKVITKETFERNIDLHEIKKIEEYEYDKHGQLIQKEWAYLDKDKKNNDYLNRTTFTYNETGLISRQANEIYGLSYQKISFIDRFNADQGSKYERDLGGWVTGIYRDQKKYNEQISHSKPKTKTIKRFVTDNETEYSYNDKGQIISVTTSYYDHPDAKNKKESLLGQHITNNTYNKNGKLSSSITKETGEFGPLVIQSVSYYYH